MLDFHLAPHQSKYIGKVFSVVSSSLLTTACGSFFNLPVFLCFIGMLVGSIVIATAQQYQTRWLAMMAVAFCMGSGLSPIVKELQYYDILEYVVLGTIVSTTAVTIAAFKASDATRAMVISALIAFSGYMSLLFLGSFFFRSQRIHHLTFLGSMVMTGGSMFVQMSRLATLTRDKAYCVDPVRDAQNIYFDIIRLFQHVARIAIDMQQQQNGRKDRKRDERNRR